MRYMIIMAMLIVGMNVFSTDFTVKNKDGKIEQWINCDISKDWKIYDINGNGKADESCFYTSDKNIVYLISEQSYDSSGKGKPNIWIKYSYKGKNFSKEIKIDSNEDGSVDMIRYENNDRVYRQKRDENLDGKIDKIEDFDNAGNITKESVDRITPVEVENDFMKNDILNFMNTGDINKFLKFYDYDKKNGKYVLKSGLSSSDNRTLMKLLLPLGYNDEKPDSFYHYSSGKMEKEEHDTNNDGKIDMQITYIFDAESKLIKGLLEKDNNYDGKFDEWHHINNRRQVTKIEKDSNFDGKVDDVKNF